jgi:hypothetical protein
MENPGYLYCTTHKPTGLMYVGSRKGNPDGDSYMGSPRGKNKMRGLFDTQDISEFEKDVLFVSDYDSIVAGEPALIKAMMDEYGERVTNIMAVFPPPPMYGEDNPMFGKHGEDHPAYGTTRSEEVKARMSAGRIGMRFSAEHRSNIVAALTGRTPSADARAAMSASKIGENNHFHGKTHSADTRAKMSASKIGHTMGAETKAKISAALTGRTPSAKTRAKLSARQVGEKNHNYGKTTSDATKKKLSDALTGRVFSAEHLANLSRTNSQRKRVINTATGEKWDSAADADRKLGLKPGTTKGRVRRKSHGGIWQHA